MDINCLYPDYSMRGYLSEPIFEPVPEPVFDYIDDGIMDGLTDAQEAVCMEAMPDMVENPMYTQGFFRTQVGRNMRVDFLAGDQMTSLKGTLTFVGASYILLQQVADDKQVCCDICSIMHASIE